MDKLKIFLSHSTRYAELAKSLKVSLQSLEKQTLLDIKLSEEMTGATDWRKWIDENVRTADVFLLLYPHASMEMGWCNYELGRFYDGKRKIVCIKNTDILRPPPAFEPYQAYNADEFGFAKFIKELFVSGRFSEGEPLNPEVEKIGSDFYDRATDVKTQLTRQFKEARVREQFYERRIIISICYDDARQVDPERSTVQGNAEGLNLLGLDEFATVKWSQVRGSLDTTTEWPAELERAMQFITTGSLPPALPPFRKSTTEIYIPVITKAESVDGVVRQLIVIFVEVNAERLRPLLNWSFPVSMPATLKYLLQVVRMVFSARWEILEPRFREAKYKRPSPERCSEIARSVIADYDEMQCQAENQGMTGLDEFYGIFDPELKPEVIACGEEWTQLTGLMRATPADNNEELSRQLNELLKNNAKWLSVTGKQFIRTVAEFG